MMGLKVSPFKTGSQCPSKNLAGMVYHHDFLLSRIPDLLSLCQLCHKLLSLKVCFLPFLYVYGLTVIPLVVLFLNTKTDN